MQIIYKNLEYQLVGIVISSVCYGVVVVLSGNCFFLLQKKRGVGYTKRLRLFLLTYVAVMFLLSTSWILLSTFARTQLIRMALKLHTINVNWIPAMIPLIIWGGDGFMVSAPLDPLAE